MFKNPKILLILFLLANTLISACNNYKTPPPLQIVAKVDGFQKFFKNGDTLVVVGKKQILTLLISKNGNVSELSTYSPKAYIEKAFKSGGKLFLQSEEGLRVFDPIQNEEQVFLKHIQTCHKVAANDTLLYVIKGGSYCKDTAQEGLKIYNLRNPKKVKFVRFVPLQSPEDLALSGNFLYVQTQNSGIFTYKIDGFGGLVQLANLNDIKGFKLDLNENSLISTDSASISYFDISNNGIPSFKFKIQK